MGVGSARGKPAKEPECSAVEFGQFQVTFQSRMNHVRRPLGKPLGRPLGNPLGNPLGWAPVGRPPDGWIPLGRTPVGKAAAMAKSAAEPEGRAVPV